MVQKSGESKRNSDLTTTVLEGEYCVFGKCEKNKNVSQFSQPAVRNASICPLKYKYANQKTLHTLQLARISAQVTSNFFAENFFGQRKVKISVKIKDLNKKEKNSFSSQSVMEKSPQLLVFTYGFSIYARR